MKSNYVNRLKSIEEQKQENTSLIVQRIWELIAALALHDEFGFGETRLTQFFAAFHEAQKRFSDYAKATDAYQRRGPEMSNIDTALIQLLRELRKSNIDHKRVFGDDLELVITEKDGTQFNIDEFMNKLDGQERT